MLVTAQWGTATPLDEAKTQWSTDSKVFPVTIGHADGAQEFARIVEIDMSNVHILVHKHEDGTEEYIYRDEYMGHHPEYWWVRYRMEEER